jgi:hypothetical protein
VRVFSAAILTFAAFLSLSIAGVQPRSQAMPSLYQALKDSLPADSRVMINDPAQLYYYTGLGGVVLPHESPSVIKQIAQGYGVDYLVLESDTVDGQQVWAMSARLQSIVSGDLPDFLREIDLDVTGVKLYAIDS